MCISHVYHKVSLLGPLLFNIFDMVLILKATSFTGYEDDNTLFVARGHATNIKPLRKLVKN